MKTLLNIVGFFFLIALTQEAEAQLAVRQKHFNVKSQLALVGYDPVSYFTLNSPVKGKTDFQHTHEGVKYYFSSKANLDKFKANPARYEPQYGGWCAYAMGAKGEKVSVDPGTYKITDGKLYLFYNSWGNNTLTSWNKDEGNLKKKADGNWQKIFK